MEGSGYVDCLSRARPVRVLFLIPTDGPPELLDAIFAECMGRWGGRFTPIVRATVDGPVPSEVAWLRLYDPDIIYSYVKLSSMALESLHEDIYPSHVSLHRYYDDRRGVGDFRPHLPIGLLSTVTLLPYVALPGLDGRRGFKIVDSHGRFSNNRVISDNFGYYLSSVQRSFGAPLADLGTALHVAADDEFQPRSRFGMGQHEFVDSAASLFHALGQSKITTMMQLAALSAPRVEFSKRRPGGFHIFIGDDYGTRIAFWNSRLFAPSFRDGDIIALCIPVEALVDAALLQEIMGYLGRASSVGDDWSWNAKSFRIFYQEKFKDTGELFAVKLNDYIRWASISQSSISAMDPWVPTQAECESADYFSSGETFPRTTQWQSDKITGHASELNVPTPTHLRFAPPQLLSMDNGSWAVDLDIERPLGLSKYSNISHRWRFPKRFRLARFFTEAAEGLSYTRSLPPRVSRGNLLTAYSDGKRGRVILRFPDDEEIISRAFRDGRAYLPSEGFDNPSITTSGCEVRRSSSGKHFWGVLRLLGGLNDAERLLTNAVWRDIFDRLGGSGANGESRRDIVLARLRKRISGDISKSESDLLRLSGIILEEAETFRHSVPNLNWPDLLACFSKHQDAAWIEDPSEHLPSDERRDYRDGEVINFRDRVRDLCGSGVLHQGYEYRCLDCLHRSWIAIENVRQQITCEVCGQQEVASVDKPWNFRLNGFLREALRQHGILPLVWATSKLRSRQENCLIFEGPLDVYFDAPPWSGGKPLSDIDLTLIQDGRVTFVEVKQSARQLHEGQIETFAALSIKLRPDRVVLAIMEARNSQMDKAFSSLEEKLRNSGISCELVHMDENRDFKDFHFY